MKSLVEDFKWTFSVCASCVKPYDREGAELNKNAEVKFCNISWRIAHEDGGVNVLEITNGSESAKWKSLNWKRTHL